MPESKRDKWRRSMLAKFGGDEAKLTEHLSAIGRRGGQFKGAKGFASDKQRARESGSKGGIVSAERRRNEKK